MQFFKTFFVGLTTVFAWAPATLLTFLAVYGVFSGVVNFGNSSIGHSITLVVVGLCGVLGYIALTAICWGMAMSLRVKFGFLLLGVGALTYSLVIGRLSGNQALYVENNWVDYYLFVGPLGFSVIHLIITLFKLNKGQTT